MELKEIKEKLEAVLQSNSWSLSPDNHDVINLAIALFDYKQSEIHGAITAEAATKIIQTIYKLVESSNETTLVNKEAIQVSREAIKVNKTAIFTNVCLTVALVLTTLCVGLLQAWVIWNTSNQTALQKMLQENQYSHTTQQVK